MKIRSPAPLTARSRHTESHEIGKEEMTGYQASPRGGIVKVRPVGDRVFVSGQAVTVLRGELPPAE